MAWCAYSAIGALTFVYKMVCPAACRSADLDHHADQHASLPVHTRAHKLADKDDKMPSVHYPVAVLLVVALFLLAGPAAAAAYKHGGGRMVIIRAPGATKIAGGGGARSSSRYNDERRLVEDEVASELAAAGLLGVEYFDFVSSQTLTPEKPVCFLDNCAGRSGKPYIPRACDKKHKSQGC